LFTCQPGKFAGSAQAHQAQAQAWGYKNLIVSASHLNLGSEKEKSMALYGIYGSHTVDACPLNNRQMAEKVAALAVSDMAGAARKYQINQILGHYHSALEHTFVWVVDAEDPHLIEQFCLDSGVASFNTIKIVPLITFKEGVLARIKAAHGL
jgi:hypothetical protein